MRLLIIYVLFSHGLAGQSIEQAKKWLNERNPTEAKKVLGAVKKDHKEFAEAQYWLGRIAYDEKELGEAETFFENAIEADGKRAEYHNWYGNTLAGIASDANLFKQGMLAPRMKSAWEKAVALNPGYIEPRQSLIQFYLQAPGMMGGSVEKAREMAHEIKKLKPAEGHRQLGNIYSREKNWEAAEKEYLAMVAADASYQLVLANYYTSQKHYAKAFELFESALKKNPDDMMATYQIGKTSALSGERLARGEECLKKYLAYQPKPNEPSHAGANMRLAQIFEKRGNKAEAKKLYEQALKSDASLKEAKDGLDRVSR
jgi:Tfp pilus assembly protein PilF